ncbi:glycine-rich cell wall structural protein 1.8-like [Myzus persicae]|uniref:glycine-rich cell wall structural protein 1.8-like n=1 Tax=Myzus persicae TaxID=13164 RepID=UPI000B9332FC|nr:glycine-rich cell wall structural protein 1.8-like [Myzus persicae]XP_022173741.1 glycine-rich cell wall structural protein 1.8-like [Myzus persicae]
MEMPKTSPGVQSSGRVKKIKSPDQSECGFCKRGKKIDPDLSGFSQPSGLRVRSIPTVLFQVFGPVGCVRRTSGGLDHRISVVVVVVISSDGIVTSGCGGSRYGGITTGVAGISTCTTAAVGAGGDGGGSAYAVVSGGGGSGDSSGGAFGIGGGSASGKGGGGASGIGSDGAFGVGGGGAFGVVGTTTVVVVSVGYDYGVSGAIGAVAVGSPEHSQHNKRATGCSDYSAAVNGHPPSVNETSTKIRPAD